MKLPALFEDKMKYMLKDEFSQYEKSLERDAFHGLRVNTSKISVEEFLKISPFNLERVPWTSNGFYYSNEDKPAKHPYYYAGLYYIQEPSAMTSASFLPIEPGDKVLDICAAPGGKSTELGAKLNGNGILVSNDISNSRAKALLKNLELFGIPNMVVASEPPNELVPHFSEYFDKILIDAPCSGEGMFRKSLSMVKAWENNGTDMFVTLQRNILKEVVKMLKPGGTLLYSTCTFNSAENEGAMEYLLSLDDSFEFIELPMYEGFDTGHPEWSETNNQEFLKCRRIWPHRVKGEGHFIAMARKGNQKGNNIGYVPAKSNKNKISNEAMDFIKKINIQWDLNRIEINNDRLFYLAKDVPDLKGVRLLRNGLFLGEMKKNRFEPSQSLAMSLKEGQFTNCVNLSCKDERVIKYLKGETIDAEALDGFVLVLVDGYPLGWGKINNGTLKNKYLPGWRWL